MTQRCFVLLVSSSPIPRALNTIRSTVLDAAVREKDCVDAASVLTLSDLSPLAVFAFPYYMSDLVHSAPLPELQGGQSALVADPKFQEIVQRSRSLTEKILLSIPETHKSCIHTEVRYSIDLIFIIDLDRASRVLAVESVRPYKGLFRLHRNSIVPLIKASFQSSCLECAHLSRMEQEKKRKRKKVMNY